MKSFFAWLFSVIQFASEYLRKPISKPLMNKPPNPNASTGHKSGPDISSTNSQAKVKTDKIAADPNPESTSGPISDYREAKVYRFETQDNDTDLLINYTNDLFWNVTSDFKLISANSSFLKKLKDSTGLDIKPGDDLLVKKLYSEEFLIFWKECYKKALTGVFFKREIYTQPFSDRRASWTETSFNPIYSGDSIVGIACFARDITDKKIAEERIKESELRYRSIFEQATEAICIADASMKIIDINSSGCHMLGYTKEEFLKLSFTDIFIKEDLINNPLKIAEMRSGNVIRNERIFKKKDGTIIPVEISGKILDDGRFMVFVQDITERENAAVAIRKSEQRYRSIIEQATDAICVADASKKSVDFNRYACQVLGYTREEAMQLSVHDIVFEEDLVENPFRFDEMTSGKILRNERRIKRKDGSALVMEVSTRLAEDGSFVMFGHDVSERRESERLIKESEAKYRSFFESSMDGMLLTVTNGEILSANPAACGILKMSEEEICAAGRSGITDESDPRLQAILVERMKKGKARGEITMLRKDGSRFEAEITTAVFTDSHGPNKTSIIIRDITERKLAETLVKESNERYNLISRVTHDMVWDWDLESGNVYRNKEGWKKIFRTGNKEVENELIEDWNTKVHPDDHDLVKKIADKIYLLEEDFFEVECRVQRDDGSYAYIHDRGNIIRNEQGKPIRLIGATQDITKRKEAELRLSKSELRFRSLVQNSSDIICIFNDRGYFTYSSPAIKQVLGFEPEDTIQKNAFAFLHPDDTKPLKEYLSQAKPSIVSEIPLMRFQNTRGEWRWIESKVTDMSDNPEVAGYVFNCRDITEKILLEKELDAERLLKQQEITQAVISAQEQERQELGSELHDNVNQILAGSLLYLSLAKKILKIDHEYLKETDKLINTAITEIRNLSHSLIAPSLQESELLEALKTIIEVTNKTSGIKITLKDSSFDETLISDKLKLTIYRIVQEQLNNILKHASAGKIIVKLVQKNKTTQLCVKDDGVGFDTTKKAGGVGLLNIKTRASLFNGDVSIVSSPGKGCELKVLFK